MRRRQLLKEGSPEPKLIGGSFGLEETLGFNSCRPPFLADENVFLVNARSGILLLVELLAPGKVWLPSYLCSAIVDAVEKGATSIGFYEVDYDLTITSRAWLEDVRRGDLVILIDYFGFPCDYSCACQAKERGAWVLEDACQALLSEEVGSCSDFVLFSPRKFLGVPDGGVLALKSKLAFPQLDLQRPPAEWWLKASLATILRREFDLHGGNRRWFELFQEVEAEAPIGNHAMSELSQTLLIHGFDYVTIAQRRIDNYQLLADQMRNLALFSNLPRNTVPLGFPIRVERRDEVRRVLFDHEIYPPIHWRIQEFVPEEFKYSHRLASEIMTLPCDQRYDDDDISRMAGLILEVARK
jgi:dTDP-4-amino-4,6-dideoxygalactose transaminase